VEFNIHQANGQRDYPAWRTCVRILAVDAQGRAREEEFDFGGEVFERSPRFLRNGQTYRVRPQRPLAVLAALAFKKKLLPSLLTGEEAQSEIGQELLTPLWPRLVRLFPNLASPLALKDESLKPHPVHGWSFTIPQVLCRECGVNTAPSGRNHSSSGLDFNVSPQALEAAAAKIAELRAKSSSGTTAPKKKS
jgi:hypothetical protein